METTNGNKVKTYIKLETFQGFFNISPNHKWMKSDTKEEFSEHEKRISEKPH